MLVWVKSVGLDPVIAIGLRFITAVPVLVSVTLWVYSAFRNTPLPKDIDLTDNVIVGEPTTVQ